MLWSTGSRQSGLQELQHMQHTGSVVAALGLQSSVDVAFGLSFPLACADLPGPGIKAASPALQGGSPPISILNLEEYQPPTKEIPLLV